MVDPCGGYSSGLSDLLIFLLQFGDSLLAQGSKSAPLERVITAELVGQSCLMWCLVDQDQGPWPLLPALWEVSVQKLTNCGGKKNLPEVEMELTQELPLLCIIG